MSIYFFKMQVNYQLGGIDSAMGCRANMISHFTNDLRVVFTELPTLRDIQVYKSFGICPDQMLSLHQFYTDHKTMAICCNASDKVHSLSDDLKCDSVIRLEKSIQFRKNDRLLAELYLLDSESDVFHSINYYNGPNLVRTEFYTDGLFYSTSYIPALASNGYYYAKEVRKTVYNLDGSVAMNLIASTSPDSYLYPNGSPELVERFIMDLQLTENDTVIMDQASLQSYTQFLFKYGYKAKIILPLHSGHYFMENESPEHLFWNTEYMNCFRYSKYIDTIIVSSEQQKVDLLNQLPQICENIPNIIVIPAGALNELSYPTSPRKPFSLYTMSRLAPCKRIDLLIKSVIRAHQFFPSITLDIYGNGVNVP